MTDKEKIDLLNTLHHKIYDYSCSGGECEYIAVPLDLEVKSVLYKLGKNNEWIKENTVDDTEFDLVSVGFEFANWWSIKDGFSL